MTEGARSVEGFLGAARVAGHAPALGEGPAQVVTAQSVVQLAAAPIQHRSRRRVAGDAGAFGVHDAEVGATIGLAPVAGGPIQGGGPGGVGGDAAPCVDHDG